MNSVKNNSSFHLALGLLAVGIFSRLIPHAPNFTAVGAAALFSGSVLKPRWMALVLPLLILWISDLYLNNGMYKNMFPESYTGWQWMGSTWVYVGFIGIIGIGRWIVSQVKFKTILLGSILSALFFFLLTNFGVWLNNPQWPQTPAGLIGCYIFAIPYFWNTLAGDLIFGACLFGVYEWAMSRKPRLA